MNTFHIIGTICVFAIPIVAILTKDMTLVILIAIIGFVCMLIGELARLAEPNNNNTIPKDKKK